MLSFLQLTTIYFSSFLDVQALSNRDHKNESTPELQDNKDGMIIKCPLDTFVPNLVFVMLIDVDEPSCDMEATLVDEM